MINNEEQKTLSPGIWHLALIAAGALFLIVVFVTASSIFIQPVEIEEDEPAEVIKPVVEDNTPVAPVVVKSKPMSHATTATAGNVTNDFPVLDMKELTEVLEIQEKDLMNQAEKNHNQGGPNKEEVQKMIDNNVLIY